MPGFRDPENAKVGSLKAPLIGRASITPGFFLGLHCKPLFNMTCVLCELVGWCASPGAPFMPARERVRLVRSIACVDAAIESVDTEDMRSKGLDPPLM
eukprot:4406361-Amphidinium_carterae.1